MDSLVKLLEKAPPWLITPLLVLLSLLVLVVIFAFVWGFIQGREVSIWPPRIGAKPNSSTADRLTETRTGGAPSGEIGIVRYARDSHTLEDVKAQSLRQAKEEIWLIGATMHYTLNNSRALLIEKVQQGVSINVLLADPTGQDFEVTARSFGQRKATLNDESEMSLSACRDMLLSINQAPNVKGCLSVKLLDRVFTAGVYFFDPRTAAATMILVPHIFGHDAPLVPGFVAKQTGSGLLKDYFDIYISIWNKAEPFEMWTTKNSGYLRDQ